MTIKDDGGVVFPVNHTCEGQGCPWDHGMSRRDWLAGLAMQAMVAGEGARMVADRDERYDETNWKEIVASNAYHFADAMIAEGRKR